MHVPYLKCNFLFTIDRNEIESLRNIRKLILQYIAGRSSKPFNLAVFGPPGAGKSFAVEQIAYSIFDKDDFDDKATFLTFNLSQFKDETELGGHFTPSVTWYYWEKCLLFSGTSSTLETWDGFNISWLLCRMESCRKERTLTQ